MNVMKKVALDVAKDGIQANVILVQGERGSRSIAFSLRCGGEPIRLEEGYHAAIRGHRPDNAEIFNSCVVYTGNGVYPNTIVYNVTEENVAVAGTFQVRVEVANATGEVLWSPEVSFIVKENGSIESDVLNQNEYTVLLGALAQAEDAAKAAEETKEEVKGFVENFKESLPNRVSEEMAVHSENQNNPHNVTKEQIGLENVDNTSDMAKPISEAQRAAFDACVKKKDVDESANADTIPKRDENGNINVGAAKAGDHAISKEVLEKIVETLVAKFGNQIIEGNLSITGNLYVNGTSHSNDMDSLTVKDAIIVANSEDNTLTGFSGYVIRDGYGKAYGIMYDPADDCVKIGIGTFDGAEFCYDDDEEQAIATRGEIYEGYIPVWDAEKKTFVGWRRQNELLIKEDYDKGLGLVDDALDQIIELQERLISNSEFETVIDNIIETQNELIGG